MRSTSRGYERQHLAVGQRVVHDDVGHGKEPRGAQGEELGIARTGADQMHGAAPGMCRRELLDPRSPIAGLGALAGVVHRTSLGRELIDDV